MKATLRALRRRAVCAWRPRTLVLAYHHVAPAGATAPWVTVSPARFAEQMAFLADTGLALSLDELLVALRRGRMPPGGRVLVTFDDATRDTAAVACPILQRLGVPATLFIPTGLVGARQGYWWNRLYRLATTASARGLDLAEWLEHAGVRIPDGERRTDALWLSFRFLEDRQEELLETAANWLGVELGDCGPDAMTWADLDRLDEDGLFTFGAHTVRHPVLAGLAPDRLAAEIEASRDALASYASFRKVFAYPYGDGAALDTAAVAAVGAAGFEAAFTTREGTLTGREDPLLLDRVCIDDLAIDDFRWVVDTFLTR